MTLRFDFLSLFVTDMARTLDFYRRLGLEIPPGAESEQHVEATLTDGVRIAWDHVDMVRSFSPGWTPPTGSSRINLAFRCAEPAEVDRRFAEMTEAGFHGELKPWDAFWGQRYAVLRDPEGNGVDLYAPLAEG
ncbi:VOC family protein [Micromonospora krabiensis]|uniref:Uncharacterized conserved protein PhnB, glyoxalase superfamily n=1 Tax=Micromonospora krabiensis TaxID=307121 RepID=A0A1C3N0W1_9ACTN|nr:VOC family protein [Micromonospora krabiensis]SBV26204.1 Uncharacterized conserved protein PhnB, glyoxalase superfamily [Micromonospora krabiensis]